MAFVLDRRENLQRITRGGSPVLIYEPTGAVFKSYPFYHSDQGTFVSLRTFLIQIVCHITPKLSVTVNRQTTVATVLCRVKMMSQFWNVVEATSSNLRAILS